MVRWISLLLSVALLTGCARQEPPFVWSVEQAVDNLDPQVAVGAANLLAAQQIFRGLFRPDEAGRPQPDCCVDFAVTEDGLTWEFLLEPGLTWADSQPVTAADFAFGLKRAMDPLTGCPDREKFDIISEVSVSDRNTLLVALREPDPDLPLLLCLPGAMPCREDFFESCRGRYGLTAETTLANGFFAVKKWTAEVLTLSRREGSGIALLRLAGPASGLTVSGEVAAAPVGCGVPCVTWAMLLNPNNFYFAQPAVAQAVAACLYQTELPLPEGWSKAGQLLPPIFGDSSSLPDFGEAPPLLWAGLEELGANTVQGLVILTEDTPEAMNLASACNQAMQRTLGIFCKVKPLPRQELLEKVRAENYDLALVPCLPTGAESEDFFRSCAALLNSSAETELQLLEQAHIVPLCVQALALKTVSPMEGLKFSPFTRQPDFRFAAYAE